MSDIKIVICEHGINLCYQPCFMCRNVERKELNAALARIAQLEAENAGLRGQFDYLNNQLNSRII